MLKINNHTTIENINKHVYTQMRARNRITIQQNGLKNDFLFLLVVLFKSFKTNYLYNI